MTEYLYQIKGKDNGSGFGNWAWPPLDTGMVEAPNRKAAQAIIEEQYGRKFPTRVLAKDLDSNEFLLVVKEIKADDHYTRELFEVRICKNDKCGRPFKVIEKYTVNNPGGGPDYCCHECRRAKAAESADYIGEIFQGTHPPVIYRITNKTTGLCYIGKTRQAFTLRWYQHVFQGGEAKFHKALRETPITAWTFEVIEMVAVPPELKRTDIDAYVSEREAYHIASHGSAVNGYNTQGPAELAGDLFDQEEPHGQQSDP